MKKIIYGLGNTFEEYIVSRECDLEEIVALCDKNEKYFNKMIYGLRVISPEEVLSMDFDMILVSSRLYFEEIKTELIFLGVNEDKIKLLEYDAHNKYLGELSFWNKKYREENECFINSFYKQLFYDIAQEENDDFVSSKIMVDFGCGPRGSLAWANRAKVCIGVDVLANEYMRLFGECLSKHNMIYVRCDEAYLPLPDNYVDILSTINSLDHVDDIDSIVSEFLRVMKSGATLLASFNLNEPVTVCEPQTLSEELLLEKLLCHFDIVSRRMAIKDKNNSYKNLREGKLIETLNEDEIGVLWVKAIKK